MSFISYAQNGEDVLLWRALGHIDQGFYIDVGANDPLADSVTKVFYDAGWSGINIEPLPAYHQALAALRPRDVNLALAAGASEGTVTLFDVPAVTGWASSDPAVAAVHRANGFEIAELIVPMRTLSAICAEHAGADIHFLKIDVEGFEGEVLRGLDLERWRPWVMVVEATLPNSRVGNYAEWEPLVTGHGYRYVWFDGLNRYYVANEHAQLANALALQPNVFDDVIPYRFELALRAGEAAGKQAAQADERALRQCARAKRARLREKSASVRAAGAGKIARRALSQLAVSENTNAALQAALLQERRDAGTLQQRALAVQAWAAELEQRLLATRSSTSWRVTAPLRLAGSVPRRVTQAGPALRALLRRAALRASASQQLRRIILPLLLRFPGRLAQVTQMLAAIRQSAPPVAASAAGIPEQLRAMPAKARRVLADLERARMLGSED